MAEFWGFVIIALLVALPVGAVIAGILFIFGVLGEAAGGAYAAHDNNRRKKSSKKF